MKTKKRRRTTTTTTAAQQLASIADDTRTRLHHIHNAIVTLIFLAGLIAVLLVVNMIQVTP